MWPVEPARRFPPPLHGPIVRIGGPFSVDRGGNKRVGIDVFGAGVYRLSQR
jgi:hypothetical protein